jgi:hypothetical protein
MHCSRSPGDQSLASATAVRSSRLISGKRAISAVTVWTMMAAWTLPSAASSAKWSLTSSSAGAPRLPLSPAVAMHRERVVAHDGISSRYVLTSGRGPSPRPPSVLAQNPSLEVGRKFERSRRLDDLPTTRKNIDRRM